MEISDFVTYVLSNTWFPTLYKVTGHTTQVLATLEYSGLSFWVVEADSQSRWLETTILRRGALGAISPSQKPSNCYGKRHQTRTYGIYAENQRRIIGNALAATCLKHQKESISVSKTCEIVVFWFKIVTKCVKHTADGFDGSTIASLCG